MQIRPIRTDKDHRAALAEIEKLWVASIGHQTPPAVPPKTPSLIAPI
jgi:antitoxin component HigA of HigAB toxin-antitoxin module